MRDAMRLMTDGNTVVSKLKLLLQNDENKTIKEIWQHLLIRSPVPLLCVPPLTGVVTRDWLENLSLASLVALQFSQSFIATPSEILSALHLALSRCTV